MFLNVWKRVQWLSSIFLDKHKISPHISYKEAVRSATAIRKGIDNTPSILNLYNMKNLAYNFFEPLRDHFGVPLYVSSFFRSKALNEEVGGAKYSDHLSVKDTSAIDIDQDVFPQYGVTNNDLFHYIKDNMKFYKLIGEFPNRNGKLSWVHISYSTNDKKNNKRTVLISYKDQYNDTVYMSYKQYVKKYGENIL